MVNQISNISGIPHSSETNEAKSSLVNNPVSKKFPDLQNKDQLNTESNKQNKITVNLDAVKAHVLPPSSVDFTNKYDIKNVSNMVKTKGIDSLDVKRKIRNLIIELDSSVKDNNKDKTEILTLILDKLVKAAGEGKSFPEINKIQLKTLKDLENKTGISKSSLDSIKGSIGQDIISQTVDQSLDKIISHPEKSFNFILRDKCHALLNKMLDSGDKTLSLDEISKFRNILNGKGMLTNLSLDDLNGIKRFLAKLSPSDSKEIKEITGLCNSIIDIKNNAGRLTEDLSKAIAESKATIGPLKAALQNSNVSSISVPILNIISRYEDALKSGDPKEIAKYAKLLKDIYSANPDPNKMADIIKAFDAKESAESNISGNGNKDLAETYSEQPSGETNNKSKPPYKPIFTPEQESAFRNTSIEKVREMFEKPELKQAFKNFNIANEKLIAVTDEVNDFIDRCNNMISNLKNNDTSLISDKIINEMINDVIEKVRELEGKLNLEIDNSMASIVPLLEKFREIIHTVDIDIKNNIRKTLEAINISNNFSSQKRDMKLRWESLDKVRIELNKIFENIKVDNIKTI